MRAAAREGEFMCAAEVVFALFSSTAFMKRVKQFGFVCAQLAFSTFSTLYFEGVSKSLAFLFR